MAVNFGSEPANRSSWRIPGWRGPIYPKAVDNVIACTQQGHDTDIGKVMATSDKPKTG